MGPPAARPITQPSVRSDEKQGRASRAARRVPVVDCFGAQIDLCDDLGLKKYAKAENAEEIRSHGGKLVAIKLLSFGDDRRFSGEQHGRSTITTERVRNDAGQYIGGEWNRKHKAEHVNHADPPPAWSIQTAGIRGPVHPPVKALSHRLSEN